MKYLMLILLAFLAQLLEGCATHAAMSIGRRTESLIEYQPVYANNSTLVLHYKTNTSLERWGSVSLHSLKQVPATLLNEATIARSESLSLTCSTSRTTPPTSLPPQIPLHQHYNLPIMQNDKAPVSAYINNGYRALILLRRNPTYPEEAKTTMIMVSDCPYNEWWTPYARFALTPFAVAADIITLPIQAGFMYWMLSRGPWFT
jgi:hypothetical protein